MDYDTILKAATILEKKAQEANIKAMLRERFNKYLPENDMLISVQSSGGQFLGEHQVVIKGRDPGPEVTKSMESYLAGRMAGNFTVSYI